ncbi:citrate lyase subunit beta/citryl-CoA lyase [Roseiarcus fermentans]|uniref:Citrate lyase subunit beta/citryl-CoA lyase n=1 Tax=Roseiarcus fermentans TaxID=1473586 RepID=A0A366FU05_9HYPH|nr:aldolase/citrate lyase family protein [Roseiarcus fermentans]RBP17179.1 citrate lyase subunit beta/citryl-CoA lyase [Roseiarcus fermentans]
MRSLLMTPGDDMGALAAAFASAADAVVVGLDVAPGRRGAARTSAARALAEAALRPGGPLAIARLNPLRSGETDRDLQAIMPAAPFAVLLPATGGRADVERLSSKLAVHEALNGVDDGRTAIVASIDTSEGLLAAAALRGAASRLIGLAWDAAALAADIGAEAARDDEGVLAGPLRTARAMTLFAAAAARVGAIDAAFPGLDDLGRLRTEAAAARRVGFTGKLALDPAQAAIINAAFDGARRPARR